MANPFEFRRLTARKCAYIEEQRLRNVAGAFARLRRALDNTARPGWGQSTSDRLAYLQAKFDRRVSDPGSRAAAATLIEEWQQRSVAGLPKLGPDRPISQFTDGELMAVLRERQFGQHTAKADRSPPPPKPARMPRKTSKSRTSTEPPVLPPATNKRGLIDPDRTMSRPRPLFTRVASLRFALLLYHDGGRHRSSFAEATGLQLTAR